LACTEYQSVEIQPKEVLRKPYGAKGALSGLLSLTRFIRDLVDVVVGRKIDPEPVPLGTVMCTLCGKNPAEVTGGSEPELCSDCWMQVW
jgi:hypothetical protein